MADSSVARDQLRSVVERIERLEEEKKTIADDIKDVFAEAKGNGFDTKRCEPSCECARLKRPSARNRRRCWTCISARWACYLTYPEMARTASRPFQPT